MGENDSDEGLVSSNLLATNYDAVGNENEENKRLKHNNNDSNSTVEISAHNISVGRIQELHHRSRIKTTQLGNGVDLKCRKRTRLNCSTNNFTISTNSNLRPGYPTHNGHSSSTSANHFPNNTAGEWNAIPSKFLLTFLSPYQLVQVTTRLVIALAITSLFLFLANVIPGAYCSNPSDLDTDSRSYSAASSSSSGTENQQIPKRTTSSSLTSSIAAYYNQTLKSSSTTFPHTVHLKLLDGEVSFQLQPLPSSASAFPKGGGGGDQNGSGGQANGGNGFQHPQPSWLKSSRWTTINSRSDNNKVKSEDEQLAIISFIKSNDNNNNNDNESKRGQGQIANVGYSDDEIMSSAKLPFNNNLNKIKVIATNNYDYNADLTDNTNNDLIGDKEADISKNKLKISRSSLNFSYESLVQTSEASRSSSVGVTATVTTKPKKYDGERYINKNRRSTANLNNQAEPDGKNTQQNQQQPFKHDRMGLELIINGDIIETTATGPIGDLQEDGQDMDVEGDIIPTGKGEVSIGTRKASTSAVITIRNGTTKAERDNQANVSSTGVRPTMAFTNSYVGKAQSVSAIYQNKDINDNDEINGDFGAEESYDGELALQSGKSLKNT